MKRFLGATTAMAMAASLLAATSTMVGAGPVLAYEIPVVSAEPVKVDSPGLTYVYAADTPVTDPSTGRVPGRTTTRTADPADPKHPTGPADGSAGGANARVPGSATASAFAAPPNTDFVFTSFDDPAENGDVAVTPSQRSAFETAAGVWSAVLEVEEPVVVNIRRKSFGDPGILGGAAPNGFYVNELSFPLQNVLYTPAQANQYASADLDPGGSDINVVISSDYDFDERVDGQVAPTKISLLALAVHEIGHGLGHTSLARKSGTNGSIREQGFPLNFDLQLISGSTRQRLVDLDAGPLGSALTDRVLWAGATAIAVDGNQFPEIYAPNPFERGSSTSHLDAATYPNTLMSPFLSPGVPQTAVPAVTQAMFADFGWALEVSGPKPALIMALTKDFLKRYPSPSEIPGGVAALDAGITQRQFATAYADSDEYLGAVVDGYYLSTLGRKADPGGRAYWIGRLRSGVTPADVAAGFYASPEYFRLAGDTNRRWVTDLYVEILGRNPDAGGLDGWVRAADRGVSRTEIAFGFYQSIESRRRRVTLLYLALLGRNPDAGGVATWTDVLRNGRDVQLAVSLASSTEYRQRSERRYG